jgi:hypothetical protein
MWSKRAIFHYFQLNPPGLDDDGHRLPQLPKEASHTGSTVTIRRSVNRFGYKPSIFVPGTKSNAGQGHVLGLP